METLLYKVLQLRLVSLSRRIVRVHACQNTLPLKRQGVFYLEIYCLRISNYAVFGTEREINDETDHHPANQLKPSHSRQYDHLSNAGQDT